MTALMALTGERFAVVRLDAGEPYEPATAVDVGTLDGHISAVTRTVARSGGDTDRVTHVGVLTAGPTTVPLTSACVLTDGDGRTWQVSGPRIVRGLPGLEHWTATVTLVEGQA
jgi:hypothetical protein